MEHAAAENYIELTPETEEEGRDKPKNEPQEAATTSDIAETQTEEKVEETVNVEQKEE